VPDNTAACAGKQCGAAVNNCGQTVQSPNTCGANTCVGNSCSACIPNNSAACAGKACGSAVNNCGQTVQCPNTCGANACVGNSCLCIPNNVAACAAKQCGTTVNNCGQPVQCPNTCGANACVGNSCVCTPDNSAACAGKQCGTAVNNCGQTVICTSSLSDANGACYQPRLCGGAGVPGQCGCMNSGITQVPAGGPGCNAATRKCYLTIYYCNSAGPTANGTHCPSGYTWDYNQCGQGGLPPDGCQENCVKDSPSSCAVDDC
jgi:hypothetical protein